MNGPSGQWVLSFQARTSWYHHADSESPRMSTTVRRMQMNQFDGCRRWPWPDKIYAQSNFQMKSPDDCKSFHSLVDPLWAASFWRNAETSLKHGVRLAHQKSHGVAIPSGLLRWSYGLAPGVSPPAKIDWRRGASRIIELYNPSMTEIRLDGAEYDCFFLSRTPTPKRTSPGDRK